MKDETLEIIGRRHTADDVRVAFGMAKSYGMDVINADLIAGLPGEDENDFRGSLREVMELGANNITLHTLAVKRASRLKETDEEYNYRNEEIRERMLSDAAEILREEGFARIISTDRSIHRETRRTPGSARDDAAIRSIISGSWRRRSPFWPWVPAGSARSGFPAENRLERVANVSNYEILHQNRLDEMMERKKTGFLRPGQINRRRY